MQKKTQHFIAALVSFEQNKIILIQLNHSLWFCLGIGLLQGSELAGWADGRFSFEGIDLNHNFPDLNNIMWDAQETAAEKSKVSNHYIPIPEYYTQEDAMVGCAALFLQQCSHQPVPVETLSAFRCSSSSFASKS